MRSYEIRIDLFYIDMQYIDICHVAGHVVPDQELLEVFGAEEEPAPNAQAPRFGSVAAPPNGRQRQGASTVPTTPATQRHQGIGRGDDAAMQLLNYCEFDIEIHRIIGIMFLWGAMLIVILIITCNLVVAVCL